MSSITSVSAASSASPANSRVHNHKKTAQSDADLEPGIWTGSKPSPTTNQGLFSNLLNSLAQVVGIPGIAPAAGVSGAPAATGNAAGTVAAANVRSTDTHTLTSVGANVNTNA